jgi:hypothetical protein
LTAPEQRAGELRRLWAAVRGDLDAAARLVSLVDEAVRPGTTLSPLEQAGVALHLHHFYTACEHALLRIARSVDRVEYSGADWHRELVTAMSRELPGVRDAVLAEATGRDLAPYRGFRHVVSHVYEAGLDWERLQPLALRLPRTWAGFRSDMERFLADLLQRAAEVESAGEGGPPAGPGR